ncbi:MAG: hypothetical protein M3R45_03580 [Pseudomonadota bacterium]|nr:hypothetical protein [Pseudomonadota bacterium]
MSKPIDTLQPFDLQAHPVWEYANDEEEDGDETWVRPVKSAVVPSQSENDVYHVACDLVIASGAHFIGFMSVCNGVLDDPAPIVVGEPDHYWVLSDPPARRHQGRFEAFFGAPYAEIFPLQWTLRIPIAGEKNTRSGSYSGA